MIWLSLLLFGMFFLALTDGVRKLRPLPFCGALPVAFAFWVAVESVLFNLLSLGKDVTAHAVWFVHLALIIGWLLWRFIPMHERFPELLGSHLIFGATPLRGSPRITIALCPMTWPLTTN